jgi:hypothetical protein
LYSGARRRWVFGFVGGKSEQVRLPEGGVKRAKVGGDPEDHLLKNSEGRPWTPDASLCAFAALHKRMSNERT